MPSSSYGLRYYTPIYRKLKVWSSGEGCSAYFWKVSLAKGFHTGKRGCGESMGFQPLANFSLVAPAWPFHVKVGFEKWNLKSGGSSLAVFIYRQKYSLDYRMAHVPITKCSSEGWRGGSIRKSFHCFRRRPYSDLSIPTGCFPATCNFSSKMSDTSSAPNRCRQTDRQTDWHAHTTLKYSPVGITRRLNPLLWQTPLTLANICYCMSETQIC